MVVEQHELDRKGKNEGSALEERAASTMVEMAA